MYEVVTILPDSYPSHCRVVAMGKDEEVRSWSINGYSRDASLYGAELVRYLPTVKSFADPIPPTVKITLNEVAAAVKNIVETKSISSGFVIQMTTMRMLKVAGLLVTQGNIDKVHEIMGDVPCN